MATKTCQPKLREKVNNWLGIIQDFVFPPTCLLCDQAGFSSQDICIPCLKELPENQYSCYRCGRHLNSTSQLPVLCGACLSKSPAFDETIAPYVYRDTIRYLIYTLKFYKQIKNARLLGYLLAQQIDNSAQLPDCIIPVPLHVHRYQERGFNQATEIAQTVASQLNIPLELNACVRIRHTEHQTRLDYKRRLSNLKHAFRVIKPVSGLYIAVLDDVMTTGTTANEMAKTLKRAGADRVDIWVCARPLE